MATTSVSIQRRGGVEQLLGPTLALVSEAGSLRVGDLARNLAQRGLLGRVSRDDVANIFSEAGQTVVQATIALKESGLLESGGPGVWRVTSAGLRLLGKRQPVTLETLSKRPRYREYLKRLSSEKRRRDWQELRYDYYVAGRLLTFEGSAHAAPAALAYALEFSLKAALSELRNGLVPASVLNGHDFRKQYATCLEHMLLADTFISDEFLEYAQHHFERRYPSGQSRLLSERKYWTFGASFLATYDDCIIQLERGLDRIYGSSAWSLGNRALDDPIGGRLARGFFHDNVFAEARLPEYRASILGRQLSHPEPGHLDRPDLIFASGEGLPYPGVTYEKARDLLALDLAALFVYPEAWAPHPDPSRTYQPARTVLPGNSSSYEWILKRLREEFGFPFVEATEDRDSRGVTILVYDRGAKHYWASLELVRRGLLVLVRNEGSRLFVERWISSTKAQFASERRPLRLPTR